MAHKFKDNSGREWLLSLNGWQLTKLKEALNYDARDKDSIIKAGNDPALFCDVLFVLCSDQANEAEVTKKDFLQSIDGDVLEAASLAYIEATIDFFPQRQSQALRKAMERAKEAQAKTMALADQKMDQMIDKAIQQELAGTPIGSESGNVPASPA